MLRLGALILASCKVCAIAHHINDLGLVPCCCILKLVCLGFATRSSTWSKWWQASAQPVPLRALVVPQSVGCHLV